MVVNQLGPMSFCDQGASEIAVKVTPIRELSLGSDQRVFVKDDGVTHDLYGGNKVRKLAWLLQEAQARGARRILTVGPAGSHHVLATTLFAARSSLPTSAILFRRPHTNHAQSVLQASLEAGLDAHPVPSPAAVPWALLRARRRGDYFIPPGGSNALGALGYVDATLELAKQVQVGLLPEPDAIVVPLGSGGTAAGLVAGVAEAGLKSRVLAVQVTGPRALLRLWVLRLAAQTRKRRGLSPHAPNPRLEVDESFIGAGYGTETPATRLAMETGLSQGLRLESTYTARAFAKVLQMCADPRVGGPPWPTGRAARGQEKRRSTTPECVLYWHTHSRIEPQLSDFGSQVTGVSEDLKRLFVLQPSNA